MPLRIATQFLIYEIVCGLRNPTTFESNSTNECGTSGDIFYNAGAASVPYFAPNYNALVDAIQAAKKIPSFTSASSGSAPTISLTGEETSVYDSNGVLSKGGKVPSLLGEGQKRFIRMDTLGAGYNPDDLRAIIAGTKEHTPKKKRVIDAPTKPSGSLLIDIQAKLQEGKSAGYARWAKNFNLKQLSQTLIYLEENNLLDRSVLEERTAAVTAQYHTLSGNMKSAEQRMAEIKVLQQHIINYAKTRDTYVAYRKAGYSKKFLAEHESEIILHKAAKQFFDEQGLKKLPTVKSLQAEYAQLLSEKKAMYADYQKAREDMRALQTAKANVDRILGDNSLTAERESEKDGR